MSIEVLRGHSHSPDPHQAVADVVSGFGARTPDAVLFFCSPDYDLAVLGPAIRRALPCPVAGCTSAGQLGSEGFQRGGITAVGFAGGALRMHTHLLRPLSDSESEAYRVAEEVRRVAADAKADRRLFGLLLVDGLSMAEERLVAALYQALDDVPIAGGSAGDDLRFDRTWVYHDGGFFTDAAVFSVFESRVAFAIVKLQHFVAGPTRLVITESDERGRVIREINGEPAAQAYADAIGVALDALDATTFSRHPLMLRLGDDHYIRSIQKVNPDLSLTCFCAIETGLVVSIGVGIDPLGALAAGFADMRQEVGEPALVIGCDCILRRVEVEHSGLQNRIGEFFARENVVGFSTYGEQINGLHVNQTFTGIALGSGPCRR